MNLSVKEILCLDLVSFLEKVPRKPRSKYGKRKKLTLQERAERLKQRNREHAKATRDRKKIFNTILRSKVLNNFPGNIELVPIKTQNLNICSLDESVIIHSMSKTIISFTSYLVISSL